jgi:hypothetical protein
MVFSSLGFLIMVNSDGQHVRRMQVALHRTLCATGHKRGAGAIRRRYSATREWQANLSTRICAGKVQDKRGEAGRKHLCGPRRKRLSAQVFTQGLHGREEK